MNRKRERVPVTERAVLQRVRRALAKEAQSIHKVREGSQLHASERWTGYYLVDSRNHVTGGVPDAAGLAGLARELGLLQPWEELREGQS